MYPIDDKQDKIDTINSALERIADMAGLECVPVYKDRRSKKRIERWLQGIPLCQDRGSVRFVLDRLCRAVVVVGMMKGCVK